MIDPSPPPNFLAQLLAHFARRKRANPRYSLRAFAKHLDCDCGALSKVLARKQRLSLALAKKIVKRLALDAGQARAFLKSVAEQRMESVRRELSEDLPSHGLEDAHFSLSSRLFDLFSDLSAMAVLESHGVEDPVPALNRLGLRPERIRELTERLQSESLLVEECGRLRKCAPQFRADPKDAPAANARHQRQVLKCAAAALRRGQPATQIMNGITMVVDPARIPLANKLIKTFVDDLCDLLEQGNRSHPYQLGLQLFSLEDAALDSLGRSGKSRVP